MTWAARYIEQLKAGTAVQFRPRGHSMAGKVDDGQLVTVEPLWKMSISATGEPKVKVGSIVLCRVHGRSFLHLVKAVRDGQYLIGNNRGGTNGWVSERGLFGIVTKVED